MFKRRNREKVSDSLGEKELRITRSRKRFTYQTILDCKSILFIEAISIFRVLLLKWSSPDLPFDTMMLYLLYGMQSGSFQVLMYLNVFLYNMIPVFFFCKFYEQVCQGANMSILIRVGSRLRWLKALLVRSVKYIIFYVVQTILTYIIAVFLVCRKVEVAEWMLFQGTGLEGTSIELLILQFCSAKILELLVLILLVILIDSFFHKTVYGFYFLTAGHLMNVFPVRLIIYNPIGIAFLGRRISHGNLKALLFYEIVVEMIVICITLLIWVLHRAKKLELGGV